MRLLLSFDDNAILDYSKGFIVDLNRTEPIPIPLEGHIYSVKWCPDGSKLALSVTPTPLIDDIYMKQKIHIVNSLNLSLINKIGTKGKVGHYFWSADGKYLAMLAAADVGDNTSGRILLANMNDSNPENLLPDFEGKFEDLSWTDENTLMFCASQSTDVLLGKLNVRNKKNYTYQYLAR